MKEDFTLEEMEILHIPSQMSLINLAGLALIDGRPGAPNLKRNFNPKEVVLKYGLGEEHIAKRVVLPPSGYAESLSSGEVILDKLYKNFMNLKKNVESFKQTTHPEIASKAITYAQTYLCNFYIEAMNQLTNVLNDDVFAGRAPNSMIATMINATKAEYYEVYVPEKRAKSAGLLEGDIVLLMRWPVLITPHVATLRHWEHSCIGLPPTIYEVINGDNDGDLAAIAKIPDGYTTDLDHKALAAKHATLPPEYTFLSFSQKTSPSMSASERNVLAKKATCGASIGLSNLSSDNISDYDRLMYPIKGESHAPGGNFKDEPMEEENHAIACFEAAAATAFMKSIVGPISQTSRTLKLVLPDSVPAIVRTMAPIEQKGVDVSKHGTTLNWNPISSLINYGLVDYKPFEGDVDDFTDILYDLLVENAGASPNKEDVQEISEGLFEFSIFPQNGGLREIVETFYPDYAYFLATKSKRINDITFSDSLKLFEAESGSIPYTYCP